MHAALCVSLFIFGPKLIDEQVDRVRLKLFLWFQRLKLHLSFVNVSVQKLSPHLP
jgi:hypothetical protein